MRIVLTNISRIKNKMTKIDNTKTSSYRFFMNSKAI